VRMVNVLFLASTYTLGGAEKAVLTLVRGLDRKRFRPVAAALRDKGKVGRMIADSGVPIETRLERWKYDPFAVCRAAALMRRERISVLYLLDHRNAILFGLVAAVLARVRVRLIAVHTTSQWGGRKSLDPRERVLWPLVSRFIALAPTHKKYLTEEESLPAEKVEVIRNGIDIQRLRSASPVSREELGIPRGAFVTGNVSILRPEKGHDVLLKAAKLVVAEAAEAFFVVVGDGPERNSIESAVRREGLERNFMILGYKDEAARYIFCFDIAVISSYPSVETYPLFALEAMALGKPVVSTSVGSLADIVEDGRTGLLVPPGDPEKLAAAIVRCMKERERVVEMGRAAGKKAEREFSAQETVSRTEKLMLRLLEMNNRV